MKAEEARTRASGMHDESAKTMLDIANRYDTAQQAEAATFARKQRLRSRTRPKWPQSFV
jgi:hypothetical protein